MSAARHVERTEYERVLAQRDELLKRLEADPDRAAIAAIDGLRKILPELRALKVAWFQGDVETPEWQDDFGNGGALSLDEILALGPDHPRSPRLRILLVPADFDLAELRGDDWNDAPANCNAGEPYADSIPAGSVWLSLTAGSEWPGDPE